jgi:hypothetical protein
LANLGTDNHCRVGPLLRVLPASVQIEPRCRTAVISVVDPVGVEHRHDLEHCPLSEPRCIGVVAQQKVDQSARFFLGFFLFCFASCEFGQLWVRLSGCGKTLRIPCGLAVLLRVIRWRVELLRTACPSNWQRGTYVRRPSALPQSNGLEYRE